MFARSIRILAAVVLALTLLPGFARAQADDPVWVQIEAQPSLAQAESSIRGYADRLQDVNGFALGGGWYAIALGPYSRDDANRVLQVLRREGAIPRDSYVAFTSSFRQQFWPRGTDLLNDTVATSPLDEAQPDTSAIDDAVATSPDVADAPPEPAPEPDETLSQARRGESLLTREERMQLQVALKWAGFYNAAIDGAFGRGTRGSMAEWQDRQGYDPTGVLTTRQRAELFRQYNAVLEGLDLRTVSDDTAGIRLLVPTGVMKFDRYEAPFAHFTPTGDIDARLILISQEGDQQALFGLYDIMQTLAIIPEDGPRERNRDGFTIVGENARLVSHTEVTLRNGRIKGWTLVWPSGDEERRTRLLGEMQKSFERIDGIVMPAAMGADSGQSIDLLAGLEIRKPILSRSGFYVDARGHAVTTAEAVQQCGRITLDSKTEAEVIATDEAAGIAVLRPTSSIAPFGYARFATATPRLQSEVASAGYPYEGRLAAPTLNFGKLAELQGLAGETGVARLSLQSLAGDAGGPVMDASGAVIGMLKPVSAEGRQLPPDVTFAVDGQILVRVLGQAGVTPVAADTGPSPAPEGLTRIGMAMTVLVSCWE